MRLRCIIIDDSEHRLRSASVLLEREGISVVGVGPPPADALRLAEELEPDLALVDIDLAQWSGFDVVAQLADGLPAHVSSILISTHSEADFADMIEASPALGFVPKAELSAKAIYVILNESEGT